MEPASYPRRQHQIRNHEICEPDWSTRCRYKATATLQSHPPTTPPDTSDQSSLTVHRLSNRQEPWPRNLHFGNANTYRALTSTEAEELMEDTASRLKALIKLHRSELLQSKLTYFDHIYGHPWNSIETPQHQVPLFYLTLKVHKSPWLTRPIMSCVGSFAEIFSKWLDVQLKKILLLSLTYLKDSN
jgi:hypothetical protein